MKTRATSTPFFLILSLTLTILITPTKPVFSQITVTQSSISSIMNSGTEMDFESISYSDSDFVIPLIEQTGEDQTWDLSALAVQDSVVDNRTWHIFTSFSDKPGADSEHFQDANIMVQSNFKETYFENGNEMTRNVISYDYNILSESEFSRYGIIQAEESEPNIPIRSIIYTPKYITYSLPMTYESFWENDYSVESVGQTPSEISSSVTVDGWGDLVIGDVSIPVLRVTSTVIMEISGFEFTSIRVEFVNENGLEIATLSVNENQFSEGYNTNSANAQFKNYDGLISVSTEAVVDLPTSIGLHQNFPNPFNPATQISYQLDSPAEVSLTIYSLTGQKVQMLLNSEFKQAGEYTVPFDAGNLASGVYLYRLRAGDQSFTRKMTLLK